VSVTVYGTECLSCNESIESENKENIREFECNCESPDHKRYQLDDVHSEPKLPVGDR